MLSGKWHPFYSGLNVLKKKAYGMKILSQMHTPIPEAVQ